MTRNQFRGALAKLDLTQGALADLFGVHLVTAARWARHGVEGTPAILLQLLTAGKITIADIEAAQMIEIIVLVILICTAVRLSTRRSLSRITLGGWPSMKAA